MIGNAILCNELCNMLCLLAMDLLYFLYVWILQFSYCQLPNVWEVDTYTYMCDNTVDWFRCDSIDYVYLAGYYE